MPRVTLEQTEHHYRTERLAVELDGVEVVFTRTSLGSSPPRLSIEMPAGAPLDVLKRAVGIACRMGDGPLRDASPAPVALLRRAPR